LGIESASALKIVNNNDFSPFTSILAIFRLPQSAGNPFSGGPVLQRQQLKIQKKKQQMQKFYITFAATTTDPRETP